MATTTERTVAVELTETELLALIHAALHQSTDLFERRLETFGLAKEYDNLNNALNKLNERRNDFW